MKKLMVFIFCIFVFLFLYGCDGYTKRIVKIDLGENMPISYVASVHTDNLHSLFQLIETAALNNGLKCNSYNEKEQYFGCGIGSFNLMTYVKANNMVQVELTEFGPWGKTKRFEKLEKDVNEMLAKEFPGKGYMLVSNQ